MDFPRLLVATEFPPNGAGGGAAVVRQMLKEWPAEKLFWWSCYPDRNKLFGRNVAEHYIAQIPQRLNPNRRWRMQKSWLLEKFWLPGATRHFKKTLETLKPEVVWTIPHCWSIPPIARVLPEAKIGFHVSIHDYADVQGEVNRFGARRAGEMAVMADKLYAGALTRDAICQPMMDDLRQRTGRAGTVAHAGLEQADFDYLAGTPEADNGPIRIAYAGTIVAEEAFALFAKALGQVRNQIPLPVTLDFYGDHSYSSRAWFDPAWMKENGNLAAPELARALKDCTWGFAPMELTDDNARYNRFSLPTKFASYIAAGLPIIALGHAESTVVKMASQYRVGLCLPAGEAQNPGAQLIAGLSEPNAKIKYRAEIQRCALAEFDTRRMRDVLYQSFQKCASATSM
jgi:hypothetical protein